MKVGSIAARWLCVGVCAVSPAPGFAAADDGMSMLRRVAAAGQSLTYSGVFVYRSSGREETSRIAHSSVGGQSRERIEVLDGSPREVVRNGEEVKCYLPEDKLLIVENRPRRRSFPAVFTSVGGDLSENYQVRQGPAGRVAGMDGQMLVLEPRDAYRYRHELLIEPASGLVLKASLVGTQGEALETFAFTQLNIGGPLEREALNPKFVESQLKVRKVDADHLRAEEIGWNFRNLPAGFRKLNAMRRPGPDGMEGVHVVFSDGLAAVSVFLEPGSLDAEAGQTRVGPISVYRRQIDGFRAVVIGEVPAITARRVGDGIERRKR